MQTQKKRRGLASMDQETQKAIASQGGKSAHLMGRAHRWTSEEAREAGRKGGKISRRKPKQVSPEVQALVEKYL